MAQYNECKLGFFQQNGAAGINDLQDAERAYLIAQGMTPGTAQDMWVQLLGPGAYNDLIKEFWQTAGCSQ